MKMFKTILKPFDSQVMVPYEYISTDMYASKKSKEVKSDSNFPLQMHVIHMAQRKVTFETFFLKRSISLMAKKCL